jgi:dihydropteroate synthase
VRLLALPPHSPKALADALLERAYPVAQIDATVRGLHPVLLLVDDVTPDARDAVLGIAARLGIDCATGDDWVLLAGGVSALGALARPEGSPLPAAMLEGIAAALGEPPRRWTMARGSFDLSSPRIVGILNVTPDSFSDGGRYLDPGDAIAHAETLAEAGADLLDVGAESTRPGRPDAVDAAEEWRRLEPVLEGLATRLPAMPVMVDTVKAETARRALDGGAWAINDVSGLRIEPAIADVCAAADAGLVLMHSRGTVTDMASYDHASYGHVITAICDELGGAVRSAIDRGLSAERLVLDPGLGFAKTTEQSWQALRDLSALVGMGRPVMVGPSRKRFLGTATGREVEDRDAATAAACAVAYLEGATLFRVHTVGPTRASRAGTTSSRSSSSRSCCTGYSSSWREPGRCRSSWGSPPSC